MIACGWCGKATADGDRCAVCAHPGPALPWTQRGRPVPVVTHEPGRPAVDPAEASHRLARARAALGSRPATIDALADAADVTPRTIRRWQKVSG